MSVLRNAFSRFSKIDAKDINNNKMSLFFLNIKTILQNDRGVP